MRNFVTSVIGGLLLVGCGGSDGKGAETTGETGDAEPIVLGVDLRDGLTLYADFALFDCEGEACMGATPEREGRVQVVLLPLAEGGESLSAFVCAAEDDKIHNLANRCVEVVGVVSDAGVDLEPAEVFERATAGGLELDLGEIPFSSEASAEVSATAALDEFIGDQHEVVAAQGTAVVSIDDQPPLTRADAAERIAGEPLTLHFSDPVVCDGLAITGEFDAQAFPLVVEPDCSPGPQGLEVATAATLQPVPPWPAPGLRIVVDALEDLAGNAGARWSFDLSIPPAPDTNQNAGFELPTADNGTSVPDWMLQLGRCVSRAHPDATEGTNMLDCGEHVSMWGYFAELIPGAMATIDAAVETLEEGSLEDLTITLLTADGIRVEASGAQGQEVIAPHDSSSGVRRIELAVPDGAATGGWIHVEFDAYCGIDTCPSLLLDRVVAPVP